MERFHEKPPVVAQSSQPSREMGAYCSTYRRDTGDLNASLCDLPVELKVLVLSHIERVETHHILALSSTVQEAFSLLRALPRTFDFEGVAGDDVADHLVRLLDDDRVRRSLQKERAVELIGDDKDRLCEYACGRNFEVLKWAHNELDLPWAPYPAGRVSDDVLALRVLRETWPALKRCWREDVVQEGWRRVKMVDGGVEELVLRKLELCALPAEVRRLSALRLLDLCNNKLMSLPAEIEQLASLMQLDLVCNQLTSLPAEIGQLTSLKRLYLGRNKLTSLPAEIGQLTSLKRLNLGSNKLTSLPAEIGQLTSLEKLSLWRNKLTSLPAEIGQLTSLEKLNLGDNKLTSLPTEIGQLTSLEKLYLSSNKLTRVPAEIGRLTSLKGLRLGCNKLTSLPAEIGQLMSLTELDLCSNKLKRVPAEIWRRTSLKWLNLGRNNLKRVPAAICELRAAGCSVNLVDAVSWGSLARAG